MSKKNKYRPLDEHEIHHYKVKRRKPNRSITGDIVLYFFLALLALIFVFPLFYQICNAFKPLDELLKFPPDVMPRNPTGRNFSDLFVILSQQSLVPFSRYLFNTLFITVLGTFGHVIFGSMAGYVLAKYDFPGGKAFFSLVVTGMLFGGYVTGIPNYLIMCRLHMIDTYWSMIIPSLGAATSMFLMKQFMEGFPTSIMEAAKIDGAKEWTIFMKLVMPNVKPAWLTMTILSVQGLWSNTATTNIYTENKKMLAYAMQQITASAGGTVVIARMGAGAAVGVVMMIVPITLFIFSQSQIMETMATSGLKD